MRGDLALSIVAPTLVGRGEPACRKSKSLARRAAETGSYPGIALWGNDGRLLSRLSRAVWCPLSYQCPARTSGSANPVRQGACTACHASAITWREPSTRKTSRAKLASDWEVDEKSLDAEVRRRIIFAGDADAYKQAKEASDGLEHGYLAFNEVHERARAVREKVAAYLRRCLLDELSLSPEFVALLTSAPYDAPGHLQTSKYLRSTIVGNGELAAPGEAYPFFAWRTNYKETPSAENTVSFTMEEEVKARVASGVSMRGLRFEIWGGQESSFKSTCAEPPAGPSTSPPAAASGIGFPLQPTCGGSPISSTVDALAPRSQGRHRAQVGAPQLDNLANLTANAPDQLVPRSKPIVVNPVAATSRRRSRNLERGCGPAGS